MKYRVTRTTVETQILEESSLDQALDRALDYGNQYQWHDEPTSYTVQEIIE